LPTQFQRLWRYAAAAGLVVLSAGGAELLVRATQATRLSMVFLAGVLLAAFWLGSGPAYFAAILAFFSYNFFLTDPRFSLTFEAEDVLTLTVFLAVAMLTGSLTGRVRDQAARAQARARATAALFDATREFSAASDEALIRGRLAHHLAAAARGEAMVFDGAARTAAPADLSPPDTLIEQAQAVQEGAVRGETVQDGAGDWTLRPLAAAGAVLGVAAWRPGGGERLQPDEATLLEILADAGAAAIARARLAAGKAEAETRARTEDLRNALLSSISHDLRTPLAAIMASASSLHEFGETFAPGVRKDLAATIQEETERLDAFVANLLSMTRLEAGGLSVQRIAFSVGEVAERTAARRAALTAGPLTVSIPPDLPEGLGDPVLFEQALGNVVENALRYGPPGGRVTIRAAVEGTWVAVEVSDDGPGAPPQELERIFEKFFRSSRTAHRPGTGLGLSIARGLLEGMDGSAEARNRPEGGLQVTLRLPRAGPATTGSEDAG
jgi:K+-sensing histidine kinase KdpD